MAKLDIYKKITCKELYDSTSYNIILLKKGFLSAVIGGCEHVFTGPCVIALKEGLDFGSVSAYRHEKEVMRFDPSLIREGLDFNYINSGAYAEESKGTKLPPLDVFLKTEEASKYIISVYETESEFLSECIRNIYSASADKKTPRSFERARAYLFLTLEYISRLYDRTCRNAPMTPNFRDPSYFVGEALDIIYRDYRKKISLITLSRDVGINKTTVAKAFREKTGESVADYIISYRLGCAEFLLSCTGLTVREIAGLCGFNSEAYFIKQFGHRLNTTPAAYRKDAGKQD